MKQFLLNIALLACFTLQIQAQGNLPGGFKHIIEVGRYSDYGKGYLTITDENEVVIMDGDNWTNNHYTYEYVDECKNDGGKHFYGGNLILEVDGNSAYGWSAEEFYNKVEGRQDVITLKIRGKKDSVICDFITKIRPLYELPANVKVFGNAFASVKGRTTAEKRKSGDGLTKDTSYEERSDEDFDFFPCVNFDYLITSNDPLLDKEIFKNSGLRWLQRNEKNPDILFTIARDANESISSTYIPPTSRTINEGSTTKVRYNYILHKNEYITTQNNRTITEGGYTQETKTIDVFLEISALDVKRLNDKSTTHPPIVWQTTVKRHVLNPSSNFNINDELKAYASWMTFPIGDRVIWAEETVYAPVGVTYSGQNPHIINEVIEGSRAEKIGLMPGDKLLKADTPGYKWSAKWVKKGLKANGWGVVSYNLDKAYAIEILRNGSKIKLNLQPASVKIGRLYYVGAK